jgi:hypothetical protein
MQMDKLKDFNLIIGTITGVLAIGSVIYHFFDNPFSNNQINKLMLGSWSSEYSYPTKHGYNFVKSTDSFFENGKYNIKGTLTIVIEKENTASKMVYEINGAGTWNYNSDILLATLNSLKSSPIIPKTGSSEMDLFLAKKINSLPIKIEDHLASGVTQKSRVLSIDNSNAKLITTDPFGDILSISLQKKYSAI